MFGYEHGFAHGSAERVTGRDLLLQFGYLGFKFFDAGELGFAFGRERSQSFPFQPFFFQTLLFRQPLPCLFGKTLGFGPLPREFGLALTFGFRCLAGAFGGLLGAVRSIALR